MLSVKGVYKKGQVELLDNVPEMENAKVIITFLDENLDYKSIDNMNELKFWELINLIDWEAENEDKVILPLVIKLSEMNIQNIYIFEEILSEQLYKLDGKKYAENIGEDSYREGEEYFSSDIFLYARCYVIACGKKYYNTVLSDPTQMPKDKDFESLLYVSKRAYQMKTGKDDFCLLTQYSYETFSNKEGWNSKISFMEKVKGIQ